MFEQTIYGDSESGFNDLSNHIKTFVYKFRSEFSVGFKPRTVFFTQSSISHNGHEAVIHSIYTILYIKNALSLYKLQVGLPAGIL